MDITHKRELHTINPQTDTQVHTHLFHLSFDATYLREVEAGGVVELGGNVCSSGCSSQVIADRRSVFGLTLRDVLTNKST